MPPPLALLLAILFILYLFIRDSAQEPKTSAALWIPCLWLMILGSRAVSQWLHPGSPFQTADDILEGSPIDRLVYFGLLAVSVAILWKRELPWKELFASNIWITIFILYCGVSILWSDFPLVALKRWFKGLGVPMTALIILGDPAPAKAIETVLKRCAYVHIPLSIIFIKYYPQVGRLYSEWSGEAYYTGVTVSKNMLGYLLFLFGLTFTCILIGSRERRTDAGRRGDVMIAILFLAMIGYLFTLADSRTALMCLLLASAVAMILRVRPIKDHFAACVTVCVIVFAAAHWAFNVASFVVSGAGRDFTLTGRTDLWQSVLNLRVNPWVGAGFESFWLGDRLRTLWNLYYFKPTQAHNGYIEVYLNLGWIGLVCLGGVVWAASRTIQRRLRRLDSTERSVKSYAVVATFGMAYLTAYLFYNVTEGTFQALNLLFIVFLIISIQYPGPLGRYGSEAPPETPWWAQPAHGNQRC